MLLTHGLPACQRLLLDVCLNCMVLEQLLGQRDIPVPNLSNRPPSNQGLQGPQQPLVLLDHLGQPGEKAVPSTPEPERILKPTPFTWTTRFPINPWDIPIYQG